ncbi:MAG: GDP-L-fucose synthase [Deltaproteobacteria bacterium]|nr:GDP-L-fucose synthase [Deltaproteobacteria bacterium]
MFKRSKIYVAGHAGLLGSALLRRLGSEGCGNVVTRARSVLDLTDQAQVDRFFREERPDYVFMAAGLTGGIMANKTRPAEFLHANISMQDNVFEACRRYEVKRAVFYGSSCIYPKGCPQPMKEEYLLAGPLEETSEPYAIAKIAGITACKAYNREDGVERFVALVPNSVYGPNDDFSLEGSHVLSALIRKITDAKEEGRDRVALWGSGSPLREFLFSDDAADASVFAILNARGRGHYNVGSGMEMSIRDLAKCIAGVVGYKGEITWDRSRPDGAKRKLLDSSRFATLGWRPKVTLDEGIAATCEWYSKNNSGGALCR